MKGLEWSNERYVRLHTRNTTSWALLGYETQNLWLQLLRLMDRAGVIPLDAGALPHEGIAALLPGSNDRQIEKQLESLIDRGWLIHNESTAQLVDPEFIDREEAAMSNAQRLRESRATRRDKAAMTQNASSSLPRLTHNESQPTHSDTGRHSVTQRDTPSVPSVPSAPSVPCREEDAPRVTRPDEIARSQAKSTGAAHRQELEEWLGLLDSNIAGFREQWDSWMASLQANKRKTAWAKVQEIRRFAKLAENHSDKDVLSFLETAGRREWRSFKVDWWEKDRSNGDERQREKRSGGRDPETERAINERVRITY